MAERSFLVGESMDAYGARREREMRGDTEELKLLMPFGFGGKRVWQPSDLPSLAAWFAFGRSITSAGGLVSQWNDQSGNGRHLKQTTGTNQPALQADGSILFDGNDNFMKCDAFTSNQPKTVYMLLNPIAWTALATFCDGDTLTSFAIRQRNGGASPQIEFTANLTIGNDSNLVVGSYGIACGVANGAASVLQVGNNAPTVGNAGSTNASGFCVGASQNGAGRFSNIQVKEVILYAAAHDATTRAQVIAYLRGVGGL